MGDTPPFPVYMTKCAYQMTIYGLVFFPNILLCYAKNLISSKMHVMHRVPMTHKNEAALLAEIVD